MLVRALFLLNYREVQSKILRRVYNGATPEEQRWIVRVILKGVLPRNCIPGVSLNGLHGRHGNFRQGDDCILCFPS
jgi:hypothetical protein